ncbi:MAG: YHS domain-containing protein [Lutibacter sp.]
MKTKNILKMFKIAFFVNVLFLLSSCMMLSPNHFSGKSHSNTHETTSKSNLDVVCGKTIDSAQHEISTQYLNKTYYFDTEDCRNKFQQSPDSYIHNQAIAKKNNNLVYWGLGAATMGVMMFFMLN